MYSIHILYCMTQVAPKRSTLPMGFCAEPCPVPCCSLKSTHYCGVDTAAAFLHHTIVFVEPPPEAFIVFRLKTT